MSSSNNIHPPQPPLGRLNSLQTPISAFEAALTRLPNSPPSTPTSSAPIETTTPSISTVEYRSMEPVIMAEPNYGPRIMIHRNKFPRPPNTQRAKHKTNPPTGKKPYSYSNTMIIPKNNWNKMSREDKNRYTMPRSKLAALNALTKKRKNRKNTRKNRKSVSTRKGYRKI
jgi:hypothetical protein